MSRFADQFLHRFLRIPYLLHVRHFRQPAAPTATVILLHGLGNSSDNWKNIAAGLPRNVRVMGIDLLGFGESPKPLWATYNVRTQAQAIARTLLDENTHFPVTIVGHSLGSLIAVQLARRFPLLVNDILLCSPPLFTDKKDTEPWQQTLLKKLAKTMKKYPQQIEAIAPLAVKLGWTTPSFDISGDQTQTYLATLEASILNQRTMRDIQRLQTTTRIIYGLLDILIIPRLYTPLAKHNNHVTVKGYPVGHEMMGRYETIITAEIKTLLDR